MWAQSCGMRIHVRGRLWRVEHMLVVFCGLMHDAVGIWFRIPLVSQAPLVIRWRQEYAQLPKSRMLAEPVPLCCVGRQ